MQTDNNCIVIFGASGDLTHRKLIPALYNLYKIGRLSENFSVLGVARSELNDETFREKMREALIHNEETTPETLDAFCSHLYYQAVNTSDAQDYGKLVPRLDDLHDKYKTKFDTVAPNGREFRFEFVFSNDNRLKVYHLIETVNGRRKKTPMEILMDLVDAL